MAASAPEVEVESMMAKVALECGGDISASQEDILATSSFLGADNAPFPDDSSSQEEIFATPPEATQQQEEEPVTMCTLPFTPTPSKSKSPSSAGADESAPRRKPRVGTRKVRGARISTPTPSPEPEPEQPQAHPEPQPEPPHVDPLLRAVLMIPTRTRTTSAAPTSNGKQDAVKDFIALARRKGIF